MGINFADEKVNIKSTVQFGSKRKITNPVQEEIRKSGLKIPKPEYEKLSVENYMTEEEYKAFSTLPPSQQKRAFEVFKQSPEYKRFKKNLDAQTKIFSKDVTDSVTFLKATWILQVQIIPGPIIKSAEAIHMKMQKAEDIP